MPAPAYRQQIGLANTSGANSYTVTMASAVLAGSLLFINTGATITSNILTISDNVNGAWTKIGVTFSDGSFSNSLFYIPNSLAAGAGTLIITIGNGGGATFGIRALAVEYSGAGVTTVRSFGQTGAAGTSTSTGTTPNAASSINDGDFVVVALSNSNTNSPTYAAGSLSGVTGTLTIRNPAANQNCGIEDGVATSAGTNVTATATDGTVTWIMGIQAFITSSWQISGNAGVAGATVSYSGAASGSVTADGSGNYTIPGLIAGSYTITPTLAGYTFGPPNSSQTIGHADISGVNFAAAASTGGSPLGVSLNSAWRRGGR